MTKVTVFFVIFRERLKIHSYGIVPCSEEVLHDLLHYFQKNDGIAELSKSIANSFISSSSSTFIHEICHTADSISK